MIAEISLGLQGIKTGTDLLKVLSETATKAQINEVKLGLQGALLDAQQALFAAQEAQTTASGRIRDLEQEIVRLKDWEGEKQRYELKAITAGVFAYALKEGMERGEPSHLICANCYQHGQKSILQRGHDSFWQRVDRCHNCDSTLDTEPGDNSKLPEIDVTLGE